MGLMKERERIQWDQLELYERLLLLAMTVEPQGNVDWPTQRRLCFHGVARITPKGLALTWLGRHVMAASHGLPVVVGREPVTQPSAVSIH